MTETALTTRNDARALDLSRPQDLAAVFVKSGYWQNVNSGSQAMVKILAGRELGMGAFASMQGIEIIKGRVRLNSNVLASMVSMSGRYTYRVKTITEDACSIEFYELRDGGERELLGVSHFTMEDAKRARLEGKDTYRMYPRNMLWARAMSNGVNFFVPDVTRGLRVYTEGDDLSAERHAVDLNRTDSLNAALDAPDDTQATPEEPTATEETPEPETPEIDAQAAQEEDEPAKPVDDGLCGTCGNAIGSECLCLPY